MLVSGIGLAVLSARTPTAPRPATGTTYSAVWTLSELTTRAEAGEVGSITVPRPGDTGPASLVVTMTDGRLIRVTLDVDPGAAASALASLGHGDLLTAEAWAAARATRGETAAADPVRSALGFLVPFLLLSVLGFVFYRRVLRAGGTARDAAAFTTIMPATAGTGDAAAAGA
ncbi:MAG: hypothetical protein M3R57_03210, partial [Chloroflexota bacterium]|nr:hypothetical protein [Chloroflexota bacterium]